MRPTNTPTRPIQTTGLTRKVCDGRFVPGPTPRLCMDFTGYPTTGAAPKWSDRVRNPQTLDLFPIKHPTRRKQ